MFRTQKAFTIVELLIVIVVIAILATISIVAYNGIQQRSTNSKNANEAVQAAKLLESYYSINNQYPSISATAVCIGTGFTNYTGDANGDCWDTYAGGSYRSVDPAFNTALQTIGSLSTNHSSCIAYAATACFTGPVYATSGAPHQMSPAGPSVRYWVYGQDCPVGSRVWLGTTGTNIAAQCSIRISS